MPQPPTVPQVPVLVFFDPNKRDQGLIEYWNTLTASYTPLDLGVPHLNTRDYAGFRLGIQQAVPNNFGWVRRVWVTDETNPDWFNFQTKYSSEANAFPVFIRSYREDKKTYTPRTKLTPLGTVIKLTVATDGSGYTTGTFPSLTFAGGGGSGALGYGIVAADGTIAEFVLDDGGQNYTSNPTFIVDPPPAGVTATGLAFIQPQTALLVAEQADEYPADSEFFGLYLNVVRIYETLPGPILTTRTIGQQNLTPAKYRRLIRTEETDQPVPATYTFPPGLSGDQTQISLQEETVAKARLKIISEIIAIGADALVGGETNEYGALAIYESVVNEGTPIDSGFLILKSTVTPFGNGKAVKITVKYPLDLALKHLLSKSIGQDNLIPAKYRRLVKHNEDNTLVDPATYNFPSFLSGDQTEIKYIEETIYRARLTVISEIIAVSADPLVGGEGDEFGVLAIYETVVNEGTPIDTGFLIKHSSVTPFGNGKAVKITVVYTNAVIAAVKVTAGGGGGSNGTHTNGSFTGGGGTGATFTYIVSGGAVQDSIVITNPGSGYTGLPVAVMPSAGAGAATTVYLAGPQLTSRLYDEEMQVHYDESRQIVMVGTPDSPAADYVEENTKALDVWRSLRVRIRKVPTAVDDTTAIESTRTRPFAFPGLLPDAPSVLIGSNFVLLPFAFRRARADLITVNVKTWWVLSTTKPVIPFDEIITDTVFVFTMEDANGTLIARRFEGVLHDEITTTYFAGTVGFTNFYPPTTPGFADYYANWIGNEKIIAASVTPTGQYRLWKVEQEQTTMR